MDALGSNGTVRADSLLHYRYHINSFIASNITIQRDLSKTYTLCSNLYLT